MRLLYKYIVSDPDSKLCARETHQEGESLLPESMYARSRKEIYLIF